MIYTTGFMITFVQVISIAMKKNRSVIITKQGAPVALLLVVAFVAACGLLSCSHGGDARGGDAHPSDSLAEALGNQIFTDYYNYYDASSVAKHGDDFNDNVDDSYADGHDTAAPADDDQDPDGTTAVPHDKIRGNASEAESLISLFNGMDTDDMTGVIDQLNAANKAIGSNKTYASYATEIKWYLGLAYLKAGKLDKARSMFKEVAGAGSDIYSSQAQEIVDKLDKAA